MRRYFELPADSKGEELNLQIDVVPPSSAVSQIANNDCHNAAPYVYGDGQEVGSGSGKS